MKQYAKFRPVMIAVCLFLAIVCMSVSAGSLLAKALVSSVTTDLIRTSSQEDWFYNETVSQNYGTWTPSPENGTLTADTFGTAYAMEGATYLTSVGKAYGAFEMEATFVINELNAVENPMVGIIPWYLDEDN